MTVRASYSFSNEARSDPSLTFSPTGGYDIFDGQLVVGGENTTVSFGLGADSEFWMKRMKARMRNELVWAALDSKS